MTHIRLFVDDDRDPFEGWVLARNHREALAYFREESPHRIIELSLDWYMGDTGLFGDAIAREMLGRTFYLDLPVFDDLETVYLHSSDRQMAKVQANMFKEAQADGWISKNVRIVMNTNCKQDYGRH
jgi:hypothetical protein